MNRSAVSPAAGPPPLVVRAPAKVNFGLRVLGRRADGYHRIRTRLATIALWDELRFEPGGRGARLRSVGEAGGDPIPGGRENLVLRAAEGLESAVGRPLPGVSILLRKRIPAGRGLGGGSSDAAATLTGLNRLFRLGRSRAELHRTAAAIGMDVPFFLYGGAAVAGGRGDAVFPLAEPRGAAPPPLPLVLLLPRFGISTAAAYRGLDPASSGRGPERDPGRRPAAPVGRIADLRGRPDFDGGPSFPSSPDGFRNDLERSAVLESTALGREIGEMRRALLTSGALASAMSGSGSAVYGVFDDPAAAEEAARRLDGREWRAVATRTVSRSELLRGAVSDGGRS